jgi:tetratricopeptide (TPR) repeat protein
MRGVASILGSSVCLLILASPLTLRAQDDQQPPSQTETGDNPNNPDHRPDRDRQRASELSSSKDTRIDLTPPRDDAQKHPLSGGAIIDDENASDVQEFHAWDPHKAAKDIEVGDFYYKRKNYRAARDRYKEALFYKPNDAVANYRLAECQEKTGNPNEALVHYQEYLKLLPHGPWSDDAQKAIEQLKATTAKQGRSAH